MRTYPHIVRGKKPYQQYQFRCIIPKDLISVLGQNEFRVSLGISLYSHSKIISTNLYNLSQFIFREVREGYMQNITLEDVFCFRWNWKNLYHELGEFKDGEKNGQGTYTQYGSLLYPDGRKYVGEYKNGKEWRVSDCEELVGVTHRR